MPQARLVTFYESLRSYTCSGSVESAGCDTAIARLPAGPTSKKRRNSRKSIRAVILVMCASMLGLSAPAFSAASAADELRAALKACKADAAATKSAEAMIKKHKGNPTDDQVDDWVDDQDDKLFDCLDKKL